MIKPIIWKRNNIGGQSAYVGKIKIGSFHWNGIDRDENLRYVTIFNLPGFENEKVKLPTEEEAKERISNLFIAWMKEISN